MSHIYTPFQPTLSPTGLSHLKLGYEYSPACDILEGIVHSYIQITTYKPTPYPTILDGTQAVFISSNKSIIGGSQSQAVDIKILEAGTYFGVWFYPAALRHFFSLNLSEITNQFVDFNFFQDKEFTELHKVIYRQQTFQKRKIVCEQWLLRKFKPQTSSEFDWALSLIYQAKGSIRVHHIAETIGWSSRHLNRTFQFHTGLNTKTFIKIIRMQHVCKQLSHLPSNSLNVALESGFYDQSHLIKDFNKLIMTNPSSFLNR
jgi:AraC-like DNA-binding protein